MASKLMLGSAKQTVSCSPGIARSEVERVAGPAEGLRKVEQCPAVVVVDANSANGDLLGAVPDQEPLLDLPVRALERMDGNLRLLDDPEAVSRRRQGTPRSADSREP